MNAIETDKRKVVARIQRLRRVRLWWSICWVPGAWAIYVGFHEWTGALIPYWAMVALMWAWLLIGYGVSAFAYRRIVPPVWGHPPVRDLLSLYFPKVP